MKPISIRARKVLATNSMSTVEVEIETQRGKVRSSAPMGTSRGKYEAYQLPTDDAIRKFNVIKRIFMSHDFENQEQVDKVLKEVDDTSHFREIGGNLAIAISSAFLKAFALENEMEVWEYIQKEYKTKAKVPAPLCNVVGGWEGQSDFQEYLFLPVHQNTFAESLFRMTDAYSAVADMLGRQDKSFNRGKNLESAWVTSLNYDRVLEILKFVADESMLKIGLDVAASSIYKDGHYNYKGGVKLNSHDQFSFLEGVIRKFPISYIEDPFHEDDWLSFSTAVHRWQPKMVCGDDFYATRIHRLLSSVDKKASNAAIVKPNQIGTVSDTIEFAKEAQQRGINTVFSHRSGENDDGLIAHMAVGLGCDYVKFGISGERVVKLNEMLRIEEEILRREASDHLHKVNRMSKNLREKLNRI